MLKRTANPDYSTTFQLVAISGSAADALHPVFAARCKPRTCFFIIISLTSH